MASPSDIAALARKHGLYLDSEQAEELFQKLPGKNQALNIILRFSDAAGAKFKQSILSAEKFGLLLKLFGSAPFLNNFYLRYPDKVLSAITDSDSAARNFGGCLKQFTKLDDIDSEDKFIRELRVLRNQALLNLSLWDVRQKVPIEQIYRGLSRLAEDSIRAAFSMAQKLLPIGAKDKASAPPLGIVGLGKLGGRELNLSSDIDLIYVFPRQKDLPEKEVFSAYESPAHYFSTLAEKSIGLLNTITEEGLAYRVDTRLRPDGSSGALACGLDRMAEYTRSAARPWERASMIKSRWICGPENLRREFFSLIRPFVYRRYLDYSALSEMNEMRTEIERHTTPLADKDLDIKNGFGGIREIEMITQAQQMIFGGRISAVRSRNTAGALSALAARGLLPAPLARQLKDAYRFLRRVEHGIMLESGRQTHRLPKANDALLDLALRCHLGQASPPTSSEGLQQELAERRQVVNRAFVETFVESVACKSPGEKDLAEALLAPDKSRSDDNSQLSETQVQLLERWHSFSPEQLLRKAGPRARSIYQLLLPKLLLEIGPFPEREIILSRLMRLFSQAKARETVFTMLLYRPALRLSLLELLASSDYLSRVLVAQPELLETLSLSLYPETIDPLSAAREIDKIRKTGLDPENKMQNLRQLIQEETLRLAFQDLAGHLPPEDISLGLSNLAEGAVDLARQSVLDDMLAGIESSARAKLKAEFLSRFAVLSFGKLAGKEMSYHSDLDLAFIIDNREKPHTKLSPAGWKKLQQKLPKPDAGDVFAFSVRLTQRMITFLSAQTPRGKAFTIDTRLRPSGTQGPLVCTLQAFADYYRNKAALWERLALLRARPLPPHNALQRELTQLITDLSQTSVPQPELAAEMTRLRDLQLKELVATKEGQVNLKFAKGGVFDIHYIVHALQLAHGSREPQLKTPNILQALANMAKYGCLAEATATELKEALIFYRRLSNWWRLRRDRPSTELEIEESSAASAWRAINKSPKDPARAAVELRQLIETTRKRVRSIFLQQLKEAVNGD